MQDAGRELYSREHRSRDLFGYLRDLSDIDQDQLRDMGLWYITYETPIHTHLGMLSALAERWHSEMSSFHLPTGEAIVTLEDIWNILRLLIHGWWVIFDMDEECNACHRVLTIEDVIICEGQIELE